MTATYELGKTFTYPGSEWQWIVQIPQTVAIDWIAQSAPDAAIGPFTDDNVSKIKSGRAQWLNKLAVVIEDDRGVLALYKHDFAVWLIQLRNA
jgi:hypothetical protein